MFPFSDDDDGGCRPEFGHFCFEKEFERFFSAKFSIITSKDIHNIFRELLVCMPKKHT